MLLQDSKQRKGEVDDSNAKRLCQTPHEKEKDILQVYIISHSVDNWQLHWKWAPFFLFFWGSKEKWETPEHWKMLLQPLLGQKKNAKHLHCQISFKI